MLKEESRLKYGCAEYGSFLFGSVFEKNSDSVRNEFGMKKRGFVRIL